MISSSYYHDEFLESSSFGDLVKSPPRTFSNKEGNANSQINMPIDIMETISSFVIKIPFAISVDFHVGLVEEHTLNITKGTSVIKGTNIVIPNVLVVTKGEYLKIHHEVNNFALSCKAFYQMAEPELKFIKIVKAIYAAEGNPLFKMRVRYRR